MLSVVAGASTLALLRQQFATVRDKPVGIALAYDFVRNFLDGEIDKCGSENDAKFLNDEVLPGLLAAAIPASDIAKRINDYVVGLTQMENTEKLDLQATIAAIINDRASSERKKIEALVDVARGLKAFRTIRNLHAQARERIES